jgi:hypothetical protein
MQSNRFELSGSRYSRITPWSVKLQVVNTCDIARKLCTNVELSSQADFNNAYIEHMMFPAPG